MPTTALMTTAYQTTRTGNAGQEFGDPFDFGAGHIDPVKALNPGLLFDSKFNDWRLFLCGVERRPEDRWCRCVITCVTCVTCCTNALVMLNHLILDACLLCIMLHAQWYSASSPVDVWRTFSMKHCQLLQPTCITAQPDPKEMASVPLNSDRART
jgi:hypothetical protein